MSHLAAQAAAVAALDHGRCRVAAQRVGIGLDRERGAAGEPDAGMVAGADLVVDPKRTRTTRSPRLSLSASSARTRRWRASWHSPSAMITLRPRSAVSIASLSVAIMVATE